MKSLSKNKTYKNDVIIIINHYASKKGHQKYMKYFLMFEHAVTSPEIYIANCKQLINLINKYTDEKPESVDFYLELNYDNVLHKKIYKNRGITNWGFATITQFLHYEIKKIALERETTQKRNHLIQENKTYEQERAITKALFKNNDNELKTQTI